MMSNQRATGGALKRKHPINTIRTAYITNSTYAAMSARLYFNGLSLVLPSPPL